MCTTQTRELSAGCSTVAELEVVTEVDVALATPASAEEEVLFIGTQFSNLCTAVDTSAAAACNAWCVCVFFSLFFGGLASCGGLCPCLFRHLSFLTSPLAIQTYSRSHLSPYSLLHASTSAPPRPSGTSVSPPPSTQDSTIHTLCDNLSTEKVN
jgi:hypothetical protein